jgi:RNA polymerase sigma factor (sigma-70 family)
VCNPAYFHIEYEPFFVSDAYPNPRYDILQSRVEWSDAEITAIREVLQKLTAGRILNSNDAEDLVQDTLLTMIAKYPGTELEKGPLIWSMGILRKKVGNYYRKSQRYASYCGQEIKPHQWIRRSMPANSPEVNVHREELQEIVDDTLAQLPSSQRQAMELLLAGFEAGEIVEQLFPERYQNVINRLYRGRKKLAQELAKYGYGPGMKSGMRKPKRCGIKKQV